MADLVERLTTPRRQLHRFGKMVDKSPPAVQREAAAEIEALRSALSQEREAREKAERERDELRLVGTEKELRRERDDARRQRDEIGRAWDEADARAKEAEARAASLEAALAEAREALEPFKELADEGNDDQPDDTKVVVRAGRSIIYTLRLSDLRRARLVSHALASGDKP
jgi:chromosome segregation ATPase